MKKIAALTVLLALCACGQDARVLSKDSENRGWCFASSWIKCVNELCPNGYDIIVSPTNWFSADAIIKCKPETNSK